MAKPMITGRKTEIGLAKGLTPPSSREPKLRTRKLENIIHKLLSAIIHKKGIFSIVDMDTHAPQRFIYPGSPALRAALKEIKQLDEGLAGIGMPTANEVQTMIQEYSKKVFSGTEAIFEPEFEMRAVKLSKDEAMQMKKLQALFKEAEQYEQQKELQPAEEHIRTKLLEPGTLGHRRWLWFSTLTDRREISIRVYMAHCKIFEDHPEFYSNAVLTVTPDNFQRALKAGRYKIGSPAQSAEYWQICARTLFEEFDGDPVKLLKHAGWSVETVYAWKQAQKQPLEKGGRGYDPIPGWGRKLLSLYFLYLAELGFPLPEDAYPADMHAQAEMIQTGCIDFGNKETISSMKLAEMLRKFITEYCKRKSYDVLLVAHATWLLGSSLCTKCSKRRDVPVLCPIYKECGGRVDTSWYTARGVWQRNGKNMSKGGTNPHFGIPTDFPPRVRSRKRTASMIPITPLFE